MVAVMAGGKQQAAGDRDAQAFACLLGICAQVASGGPQSRTQNPTAIRGCWSIWSTGTA